MLLLWSSTKVEMDVMGDHAKWVMCVGMRYITSSTFKSCFYMGPCLHMAIDLFLTEMQPDNLFCQPGFMMFTDVLSS